MSEARKLEQFDTIKSFKDKKRKEIRQDRIVKNIDLFKVKLQNRYFDVFNYSKFGVAILTNDFKLVDVKAEIEIVVEVKGEIVYQGLGRVMHNRSHEDQYILGVKLKSFLNLDKVRALIDMNNILDECDSDLLERRNLSKSFLNLIDEFNFYLSGIKSRVDKLETEVNEYDFETRKNYLETFKKDFSKRFNAFFYKVNSQLAEMASLDMKEGSFYLKYAQKVITPYFTTTGLGKRAVFKPLGYAGDYEMMNQLYRQKVDQGTLFGHLMNSAIVDSRAGSSVRYRREFLANLFKNKHEEISSSEIIRSLSVACGPAQEIQDFVNHSSQEVVQKFHFDLLDLDKFALKHAQSKIYEIMLDQEKLTEINFINENVIHLALGKTEKLPENEYDLIYSAGLYDYLDVKLSKLLTKVLFDSLKPGGTLVIGNFSSKNKEKVFMDLILDWFLLHKNDEEMLSIAPGVASHVELHHDPYEVISYIKIIK